jgi:hypothetical protein
MTVVFGDDHDVWLAFGFHADVLGQVDHRHQCTTQTDHPLDRGWHLRCARDGGDTHHLTHLEHVDTESLLAPGTQVFAERKHENLQLVGARQFCSSIDVF